MASAQTDSILTLEQCVDLAVENNAKMKMAENNTEAARQVRREAFTKYFPEVTAQGIAFTSSDYMLKYDILNMLDIDLVKHGKSAGITAMQPLFMGGQIVNGNKLARVGEAVAELQAQQSENEVRLTAEKYYWQLATLKATKNTLQSGINLLDTLAAQVGVAVNAGIVTNNELLKVQLQRNDYMSKMVDLDNGIKLCRMVLSQYVGAPFDNPVDIAPTQVPASVPYPIDVRVDPAAALPQTVDYQLLCKNVDAKRLEKKIEVGKNLPMVLGGAGWYYHDLLGQNTNFGTLTIAVNIPLSGWWGGSHAIKKKKLELQNAELEREDLSQMLQINMQNKWDDLTAAHRKMEIAQEAITQSSENLRLNQAFYNAGTGTISDLLDAQLLHQQALDNHIAAYGAYRTALADYLNATAQL